MARSGVKVEGMANVLRNLNSEIGKIENSTMGGLMAGGLIIQAEAQRRTPVDTGNLKGSAYTRQAMEERQKGVEVGFSAAYAIYVHEDLEAHHPNGEAKFLETAARVKSLEVVRVVAQYAGRRK